MSDTTPAPPVATPPIHQTPQPPELPLVPLPGIPFPPFVKILAACTALLFVLALFRLPGAISDGIAYERGHRAVEARRYPDAIKSLAPVLDRYPGSKEVRLDLVRAYLYGGDLESAIKTIEWFEGKKVTKDEEAELQQLEGELSSKLEAMEKAVGGGAK